MKKELVNKFDLEAAFKALDEIEVPVVKGIKPNRENLKEKFTKKLTSEILVEDYFDVNDQGDLEAAQEEREAEIAKAKLARIEKIVDLDAESEEDLLPSYVGKFIIQCPQCMTLFYKKEEDIAKSEENPDVVNLNEPCQHCGNTSGYTLIGKVDQVGEEEAENYDVEDFDENELDLNFEEETPVEEESEEVEEPVEEETAEEGNEEELELEPIEETEEENSEEEEVKESLNESRTNDWVVIQHYYPTLCRKDQVKEVTDALTQAVELFENETLGGIDEIEKEAKRISGIKDFSMLLMANYETLNIPYGQPLTAEQYAKCVLESELSRTLYVVGVNVYGKPFRDELKKAGYDSTKALRLKEAVDKELDDKLKAHNEYIEYLKDMIEKEEKSLASAKNDFVKKSIQSRIDALQADLEAALPEALKGEVETELPTAEEVELEATENTEEKEETKESLAEALKKDPNISAEEINKILDDKKLSQDEKAEKILEDVKIISDLSDYSPWSGAVDTWNQIKDADKVNELDSMLEEIYPDGLTMTELNDLLWFDSDWVLSSLGIIEEVEESLTEGPDTAVLTKKPRVRTRSRGEAVALELRDHPMFKNISNRTVQRILIPYFEENMGKENVSAENIISFFEDESFGTFVLDNYTDLEMKAIKELGKNDPNFVKALEMYAEKYELLPEGNYEEDYFDYLYDVVLGTVYNEADEFDTLDEVAELYSSLTPVKEALVGDVNINLDARGQSVGLLKGQGGEVHNDMTESFEDACKKAEQKGFVEVKVELNPAEANKCEMIIKDDSGKKHYFTTPERVADLEKAYNRGKNSEQLDEFVGPAVAAIAGSAAAASVAKSVFGEEVEEPLHEDGDVDALFDSEEFKKPISEEEVDRIIAKHESIEEDIEPGIETELAIRDFVDTWESVEEIDEESLDKLTENYLTEVYSNVKSFKTTDCALEENKLMIEGTITFNSGKTKNTKFIYEAKKENDKFILEGLNADFATEKAFILNCNLDVANRLVVESLNYKYTINNTLVEGLLK